VSRQLSRAVAVPRSRAHAAARTRRLDAVAPALAAISDELDAGRLQDAHPFDATQARRCRARTNGPTGPRTSTTSSSCAARGATMPPEFWTDPLMYQGASDRMLGPCEDVVLADEAWGIDFEGEVAVVTGDVAMGTDAACARASFAS
jgi:fumarylacetoacetate (FAA) hydrolase